VKFELHPIHPEVKWTHVFRSPDDICYNEIDIDNLVKKTLRKNDWDHKQLGETEGEIRDTLREILENPSEVYEGTRTNDDATVRVYVNEMTLNGFIESREGDRFYCLTACSTL